MAQPHIAYCGFNCAACPVFHAAARGSGAQRQLALRYSAPGHRLLPGQMDCAGCRSDAPAVFCAGCAMRTCAGARGLAHCAACGTVCKAARPGACAHGAPCAEHGRGIAAAACTVHLARQKPVPGRGIAQSKLPLCAAAARCGMEHGARGAVEPAVCNVWLCHRGPPFLCGAARGGLGPLL